MRNFLAFLAVVVSACQPAHPLAVDPAPVRNTKTVLLCRETSSIQESLISNLAKLGWVYAGPLHNDGINCTMVLWQCFNPDSPCSKETPEVK